MACEPAELLAEVAPRIYERPAVPKRVTVLEVMPVTAIGKIYKPALRLRAIEVGLQELLGPLAGGVPVVVQAREQGTGAQAEVHLACARDVILEQRLRDALAAIAVRTDFVFTG
jgi:fatty-acyl-CoA synthase